MANENENRTNSFYKNDLISIISNGNFSDLTLLNDDIIQSNEFVSILPLLSQLDDNQVFLNPSTSNKSIYKTISLGSVLNKHIRTNDMRSYLLIYRQIQNKEEMDALLLHNIQSSNTHQDMTRTLLFESGTSYDRIAIVLQELYTTFTSGEHEILEIFNNHIYIQELQSIIVPLLRHDYLSTHSGFQVPSIVNFCLQILNGPSILVSIIQNDPMQFNTIVHLLCEQLRKLPEPSERDTKKRTEPKELPKIYQLVMETFEKVSSLTPFYAEMILQLILPQASSWEFLGCLQLLKKIECFQLDLPRYYSTIINQNECQDAIYRIFSSMYHLSAWGHSCLEYMVDVRHVWLSTIEANGCSNLSSLSLLIILNYTRLLMIGQFQLDEKEIDRVYRIVEQLIAAPDFARNSTLLCSSYVLLLVSTSVAATFMSTKALMNSSGNHNRVSGGSSNMNEERERLLLQGQQLVLQLYDAAAALRQNTIGRNCIIVSAVLLYTKSPQVPKYLSKILDLPVHKFFHQKTEEALYLVGEVIGKPVLSEARITNDILQLPENLSSGNHEMLLEAMYGLLCEKSFLRQHHPRELETWLTFILKQNTLLNLFPEQFPAILELLLKEWIENYLVSFDYPMTTHPRLEVAILPLKKNVVVKLLSDATLSDANDDKGVMRSAVLTLLFVLNFNQRLRMAQLANTGVNKLLKGGKSNGSTDLKHLVFSYELDWRAYPIHRISQYVNNRSSKGQLFEFIAPNFNRVLRDEMPWIYKQTIEVSEITLTMDLLALGGAYPYLPWETSINQSMQQSTSNLREICSWMNQLTLAPYTLVRKSLEMILENVIVPQINYIMTKTDTLQHFEGPFYSICSHFVRLYRTRIMVMSSKSIQKFNLLQRQLVSFLCHDHYDSEYLHDGHHDFSRSLLVQDFEAEPFHIISHAKHIVFQEPLLCELLLLVANNFRLLYIEDLRKYNPLVLSLERDRSSLYENMNNASMTLTLTDLNRDARKQSLFQYELIHEVLFVQHLLDRIASITKSVQVNSKAPQMINNQRCLRLLYAFIQKIFSSPIGIQVMLTIHRRGYATEIMQDFVQQVPALNTLWEHFASRIPTLLEFTLLHSMDNSNLIALDWITWRFRMTTLFSLCAKYYDVSQREAVISLLKAWNLRLKSFTNIIETHWWQSLLDLLLELFPLSVAACRTDSILRAQLMEIIGELKFPTVVKGKKMDSQISTKLDALLMNTAAQLVEQVII